VTIAESISAPLTVKISGVVVDARSGEPVISAYVRIKELKSTCYTNDFGEFELLDVPVGQYTLLIGRIGYKSFESFIQANGGARNVFELVPADISSASIVVSSHRYVSPLEISKIQPDLEAKELRIATTNTLAQTLLSMPGMEIRSMGPAVAAPVIRGLNPTRITVLENGNKINDMSATSADHAQATEISGVESIEFISGAKMLTKTSSAFGSIINIKNNRIPLIMPAEAIYEGNLFFESMNTGYNVGLRTDFPLAGLAFNAMGNFRNADNYSSANKTLDNTAFRNYTFSLGSAYIKDDFTIGASGDYYANDYGIPGGFVGAHPNGVNIELFSRNFRVFSAYHAHESLYDIITLNILHSFYKHTEFESSGIIGAQFIKNDNRINLDFATFGDSFFDNGNYGFEYNFTNRKSGGYVFTPDTDKHNFAAYILREHDFDFMSFTTSLRYEYTKISPDERIGIDKDLLIERDFSGVSFALSTLFPLTEEFKVAFTISNLRRSPMSEELYSAGPHLAAYSYEVGNPHLGMETGIGAEFNIFYNYSFIDVKIGSFAYNYDNYITFRPSGDTNWSQFLPIYRSDGVRALLHGVDAVVKLNFTDRISLNNVFSFVNAANKSDNQSMPSMPPMKFHSDLRWSNSQIIAGVRFEVAFAQNRIDYFEQATPGYWIAGLYAAYSFVGMGILHDLSLNIDNIFNVEYANHLSKIRSIMPEPGRNIRLNYKFYI
jgi:iron complex outermembrane receptor protein